MQFLKSPLILLVLIWLSLPAIVKSQTIMITNPSGTQVAAGNIEQGATNHLLYKAAIEITTSGTTNLTGMTCQTSGTYQASDITNLKVLLSNDETPDGGDYVLSTLTNPGTSASPATKTFPSFSAESFTYDGSGFPQGYILITADIPATAVIGRTINISGMSAARFTFSNGSKNFAASAAGGAQTVSVFTLSIANNGSQVAVGNIGQGSTDYILHKFSITAPGSTSLTGVQCVTAGNYASVDLTNLKVRYSTNSALDAGDATLSTYTTPGIAGTKTFPSFTSQAITAGATVYIFITCDIPVSATTTKTISVNAVTTAQLTFSTGNKSGSTTAGGTQTIVAPTITISDNGTQITAANIGTGSTNNVLHKFAVTLTNGGTTLTGMTCAIPSTTYASASITNLKVRYSTDATLDAGDATLSTITSIGTWNSPATKTFTPFTSQSISSGGTAYFFITADIASGATDNQTIAISSIASANLTFSVGTKSGSSTLGGTQTIRVPSIAIADNGAQVTTNNFLYKGSTEHVLNKIQITPSLANATLTGVQCATLGTYQLADITNLKVRYSVDGTLDAGDATLSTLTSVTSPALTTQGTQTFPTLTSQLINVSTTGYIFITVDVSSSATVGRTISVNAITTGLLTFTSGSKSGTPTAAGTQTIANPNLMVSDNGTQIGVANVAQSTFPHILHKVTLTAPNINSVTITALNCVTTGSYSANDIYNLKLRYSTDATLDVNDATLSTLTGPGSAGTKAFTFGQLIPAYSTVYLFITADIAPNASIGNTIGVNSISASDITTVSIKAGSTTASGLQTITGTPFSGTVYTVSSLLDDGSAGTLRDAINSANANGNVVPDLIVFDLSGGGAGPYTITLNSPLRLTSNGGVIINGWAANPSYNGTQNSSSIYTSGAVHSHRITITSAASGGTCNSLFSIESNNNVITGFTLQNRNTLINGCQIEIKSGGSYNQILGCNIGNNGTTTPGMYGIYYGVYISNGHYNTIGDGSFTGANVISGNGYQTGNYSSGIQIAGASSYNTIKGNIIGLRNDGTTMLTNNFQLNGVTITGTANNNTVGGTGTYDGNIISGQHSQTSGIPYYYGTGVLLSSSSASGNTIIANRIGMQCNGTTVVSSNTQYFGIRIVNSLNNTIGGNSAAHRNIISGNDDTGILINGASSNGNVIKGNYIGLQANGTTHMANSSQDTGILLSVAGTTGNTVGGTGAGEGNVISGTGDGTVASGVGIRMNGTAYTTIVGNIIGLQADGNTCLLSPPVNPQQYGILIDSLSSNNTVGGTTSGARNIISGNGNRGIQISDGSTSNSIKGNYIGLQSNGVTIVASNTQKYGIGIDASTNNTIGGTTYNERNIISGHIFFGIYLSDAASTNTITGNIIGLTKNGTAVASNTQTRGIQFQDGCNNNVIGGTTAAQRNYISGNSEMGVCFVSNNGTNTNCTGNIFKGNYIGTDTTGTATVGSQPTGLSFGDTGCSNTIGGSNANEGNVISGNSTGISMHGNSNQIIGNIIGPQVGGTSAIAGNPQGTGIAIATTASSNIIGGNGSSYRNVISGNTGYGIHISGTGTGNKIKGNYIGPKATGDEPVGSQTSGIYITGGSSTIIGSENGTANEKNIISGNVQYGIYGAGSNSNLIKGNYIGPSATGTNMTTDSQDKGIYIANNAESWTIGGTGSAGVGDGNTIAYNASNGIYLAASTVKYIQMRRNLIYENASTVSTSINLLSSTANESKAHPTISMGATTILDGGQTIISGAADPGDIIEIYATSSSHPYDATEYIDFVTADPVTGVWTYDITRSSRALDGEDFVLATATDDVSFSTSELRGAGVSLPIQLVKFTATCNDNHVKVEWTTASETNNDFFTIERTSNGTDDKKEFIVDGAGNSTEMKSYIFIDNEPLSGSSYYRLKQTDFDGKFEYFDFVASSCEEKVFGELSIYPNPNAGENFNLSLPTTKDTEVVVVLYDVNGRETYSKVLLSENDGTTIFAVDIESKLTPGIYIIVATSNKSVYKKRLIVK